jgi:hypothetical protein
VLRGLDDFRVRVQENGVGSMDVSDYCQDHGVPLDPLSTPHTDRLAGGLSLARRDWLVLGPTLNRSQSRCWACPSIGLSKVRTHAPFDSEIPAQRARTISPLPSSRTPPSSS